MQSQPSPSLPANALMCATDDEARRIIGDVIRRMVERGNEHIARDLFGDAAVDDAFRAHGICPDAMRADPCPVCADPSGVRCCEFGRDPA